MENFTNEIILKNRRKCKLLIVWGVILLLISLCVFYLAIKQDEKDTENMVYLNDAIENHTGEVGGKAYLTIKGLSSAFAVNDDTTNAYYFATDGDYYYILFLKKETYLELKNKDLENSPEKLVGIIERTSEEIKKIAIDDYNSGLSEEAPKLTLLNFNNYFGEYYLNETISYSDTTSIYNVITFLFSITGLSLLFVGIFRTVNFNSNMKKINPMEISLIESEMNSSEAFYYNKLKLYLTKNYLIILNGNFIVYKYSDILWMYPFEQKYYGATVSKAIKIFTVDGKTTMFANISIQNKTQKQTYEEIWETILNKNSNIKLGYTKENIAYFKEVSKEIKSKRKNNY